MCLFAVKRSAQTYWNLLLVSHMHTGTQQTQGFETKPAFQTDTIYKVVCITYRVEHDKDSTLHKIPDTCFSIQPLNENRNYATGWHLLFFWAPSAKPHTIDCVLPHLQSLPNC